MGHWKSGYWFESLQCQFSLNSARKVASFPPKVRQLQFLPIQIISKGSWVTFATATAIRYISKICFFSPSKLAATKKPSSDKCLPLQECVALARGDKTSYQMGVNIIELMELLPIVKHHQTQPPLTGDSLIIQVWIKGKRWKQYKKLKRLLIENVYCTKMDLQQLVERHVTHFPRYDDGFGKAKHGGRANRKRRWIQYICRPLATSSWSNLLLHRYDDGTWQKGSKFNF